MKIQRKQSAWLFPALLVLFFSCKKEGRSPAGAAPDDPPQKNCRSCMEGIGGTPVVLENNGKKVTVMERNGEYYLQGDMRLSKEQIAILKGESKPDARTGTRSFARLWPNRTVFYTISPSMPWVNTMDIQAAIDEWENNTNLQFVPRTTQTNYVEFVPHTECSSPVGMVGGRQEIRVSPGCLSFGIAHEIGHAIGFFHEQSRRDRGSYVTVHTANIAFNKEHNFYTYDQTGIPGFRIGTFDWESIMLYDSWAFSSNGQPTMTRLDGSTFTGGLSLSAGDISTYNHMYNRPYLEIVRENVVRFANSQRRGTTWDCVLRAWTDASKTTPATLTWPLEYCVAVYWHDTSAPPGGGPSPFRVILSPGQSSLYVGEGYSIMDYQNGSDSQEYYFEFNDGFGD